VSDKDKVWGLKHKTIGPKYKKLKIQGLTCTWHTTLFLYNNNAFISR
jgi:hypothetical protein